MRNFDKVETVSDRAIASYQFHVNHTFFVKDTLDQQRSHRSRKLGF